MARSHRLTRNSVKKYARSGAKGVYQLRRSRTGPVRYVGRSDTDVQRRLLEQVRQTDYSYFTVEHKGSSRRAWKREAHLYHYHRDDLDNDAHPTPPAGMSCPKCSAYD